MCTIPTRLPPRTNNLVGQSPSAHVSAKFMMSTVRIFLTLPRKRAADKSAGLADAYRGVADGIHLDADRHARLGRVLADFVAGLPEFSSLPLR
jgi:hypothetical protein